MSEEFQAEMYNMFARETDSRISTPTVFHKAIYTI